MAPSFARNSGQIPGSRRERTVVTASNDIDEIYHRMAVIRRELHTNVRESVAGAEAFADWGRYTWTYPWIALGAAVAVGYLIYTSGRQTVMVAAASPAEGAVAGESVAEAAARVSDGGGPARLSCSPRGASCPRGRPRGPELPVASARTTIPDEECGTDRSLTFGRRAGRSDGPGGAVGRQSRSSGFNRNQVFWRLER